MVERGENIFLCAYSEYRSVYAELARKLKESRHARIHLYVNTAQDAAYYRDRYTDLFDTITEANSLYATSRLPVSDTARVISRARMYEDALGITINQLAVRDRHLGRGFAPGGYRHPRSRISEKSDYFQMINGFTDALDFWQREIDDKQPVLILNGNHLLCVIAKTKTIPVRILMNARYQNYYYWAHNDYLETPVLQRQFSNEPDSDDVLPFVQGRTGYLAIEEKLRQHRSYFNTIKKIFMMTLRSMYGHLRRYEKAKIYYWHENVAYLWRYCRIIRDMTSSRIPNLAMFKDMPFVFFPLSTEPERALQHLSPEYLFQLEAIITVARDLPAGVTLVVKEHFPAVGRRPRDFYNQITELKNVHFINMAERGLDVLKMARAVVTVSGSAGLEAAVLGKPVITFGRHNIYNVLPHVEVVNGMELLHDRIAEFCDPSFDQHAAARDGQRFLRALVKISFDLGAFTTVAPDKIEPEVIDVSFAALLDSLGWSDKNSAPSS